MFGIVAAVLILGVAVAIGVGQTRGRTRRPEPVGGAPVGPADTAAGGASATVAPAATDPVGRLVGVLRQRRWLRRTVSAASVAAGIAAVMLIGYPFYTNLVQSRLQSHLAHQLASPELRQAYLEGNVKVGDSLTRIKIPRINVDVVVVEGTTADSLRAGAGHYVNTPLPCEQGNVGIAGHRTTYGRPFNNLDLLRPGDVVILETPISTCTYKVSKNPFVTLPTDVGVLAPTADAELTMTTCNPKGSARERLIVNATLVSTEISSA